MKIFQKTARQNGILNQEGKTKVVLSAAIAVLVLAAAGVMVYQKSHRAPADSDSAEPSAQHTYAPVTELKIKDLKVGTGTTAEPGKQVTVQYTGWLTNGTKFDSSYDHGQPFTFRLSKEGSFPPSVIQGWDKGLLGMKEGGKRRLIIPPQMGYGANGAPPLIPPNSTLVFEVELLKVQD